MQFCLRVVGGDPSRAVSQEVLAILKRNTCCPKTAAESVFEIVHPHVKQTSSIPGLPPRPVVPSDSRVSPYR